MPFHRAHKSPGLHPLTLGVGRRAFLVIGDVPHYPIFMCTLEISIPTS